MFVYYSHEVFPGGVNGLGFIYSYCSCVMFLLSNLYIFKKLSAYYIRLGAGHVGGGVLSGAVLVVKLFTCHHMH